MQCHQCKVKYINSNEPHPACQSVQWSSPIAGLAFCNPKCEKKAFNDPLVAEYFFNVVKFLISKK